MNQPKPIPENMPLDDLHPTRFLKAADLLERWRVQSVTVTIDRLQMEETEPRPGTKETKPVLYFKTRDGKPYQRGMLLSARVMTDALKTATGAQTVGQLAGKKINIIVGEHKGRAVLRIDPQPVKESES